MLSDPTLGLEAFGEVNQEMDDQLVCLSPTLIYLSMALSLSYVILPFK